MKFILNFLLFLLAVLLFYPLSIINLLVVLIKGRNSLFKTLSGYFYNTALSIDHFANREFRTLWNLTLIKQANISTDNYYSFGEIKHTISYVLGKNKAIGSLSKAGFLLCNVLNLIDKNHVEKAVENEKD